MAQEDKTSTPSLAEKRILCIDDDPRLLSLVEGQLQVYGAEVLTAQSAQEGLSILEASEGHLPDVILCDIMMPKQDGYSFHKTVRNHPQWLQIPFVYVSALTDEVDYRKGMNLGADGYLTKPVDQERLVTEIQHVLRRVEVTQADERTEIYLLGAQHVRVNNSLSKAPDRGAEQLVFYMIIQGSKGQHVRRRRNDIMAELWKDITLSGFRSVLSRAKRWSEDWSEWRVTSKEIFFNLKPDIWCDYYEIKDVLNADDNAKALEQLYRGVLLPNYQEEWVQTKREHLANHVKAALLHHVREDMSPRERAFQIKQVLKVDPEDFSLWDAYISNLEEAGLQHEAQQARAELESQPPL